MKGGKEKYQIINPSLNEKAKEKRPQSCGGVRQRPGTGSAPRGREEIHNFNSTLNNGFKGLRTIKNNFTNNENPYDQSEQKDELGGTFTNLNMKKQPIASSLLNRRNFSGLTQSQGLSNKNSVKNDWNKI